MRFSIDFPELSRSKRRAGSKFFSGATRAPRKHTSCCGNGRHRCTGVNVYATGSNAPQHLWAMHGDLIPPTRCARLLAPFAHCRWGSLIAFAECHACLLSNVERDAAGGMSRSDLSGGGSGPAATNAAPTCRVRCRDARCVACKVKGKRRHTNH